MIKVILILCLICTVVSGHRADDKNDLVIPEGFIDLGTQLAARAASWMFIQRLKSNHFAKNKKPINQAHITVPVTLPQFPQEIPLPSIEIPVNTPPNPNQNVSGLVAFCEPRVVGLADIDEDFVIGYYVNATITLNLSLSIPKFSVDSDYFAGVGFQYMEGIDIKELNITGDGLSSLGLFDFYLNIFAKGQIPTSAEYMSLDELEFDFGFGEAFLITENLEANGNPVNLDTIARLIEILYDVIWIPNKATIVMTTRCLFDHAINECTIIELGNGNYDCIKTTLKPECFEGGKSAFSAPINDGQGICGSETTTLMFTEVTTLSTSPVMCTEVPTPDTTTVTEITSTEVTKTITTEITSPEITESITTEITNPEITETTPTEITNPEITETTPTEITNPETTPTEITNPEITETTPTEITNPEITETTPTEITNPEITETTPTEITNPEITETTPTEITNPETTPTEITNPEITETTPTEITNPEITETTPTEITNPEITETTPTEITNPEITETTPTEITASTVTETTTTKATETPNPDTTTIKVTETPIPQTTTLRTTTRASTTTESPVTEMTTETSTEEAPTSTESISVVAQSSLAHVIFGIAFTFLLPIWAFQSVTDYKISSIEI